MIYWTALSLGFLGSLHCLGMCAPLMLAFPMTRQQKWQFVSDGIQYNIGRVLAYGLLGLLFGTLGKGLFIAGMQQEFTLFLGILLLLTVLFKINVEYHLLRIPLFQKYTALIRKQINHLLKHPNSHFLLGFVNGFLPCGLVYLALAGAVTTATAWSGSLFMILFGLGTVPLMLSTFLLGRKLQLRFRKVLLHIGNFAMLVLAIGLLYRGLNVEFPRSLEFWEALKNPVMCH